MKSTVLVLAALASAAFGQTATPEPEFPDVFYGLEDGQLVKLERQAISMHVKLTSPMSAKAQIEIAGGASPVRFHSGQPLDFIVRSPVSTVGDPDAMYHVRKLESRKHNRLAQLVHASPFGASTKSSAEGVMPVAFSRYGASSVKMTTESLAPGEYAVGRQHGETVFCFGVDVAPAPPRAAAAVTLAP